MSDASQPQPARPCRRTRLVEEVTWTGVPACSDCETKLTPVFDDVATDTQFDGALWISFDGAYGMYIDPFDGPDDAVLCADCATRLCETSPWVARLLGRDRSEPAGDTEARDSEVLRDGQDGQDGEAELEPMVVISTSHLSPDDTELLPDTELSTTDELVLRIIPHRYGWLIHIPSPFADQDPLDQIPDGSLSEATRWARKRGATWLNFDQDGEQVADLTVFTAL